MMNLIIGIGGTKHSGKDTAASMFNYILSVGLARANYKTWLTKKEVVNVQYKNKVIHFADTLKDCLSLIYNIPRGCFDNPLYKDEMWFNLYAGGFLTNEYVNNNQESLNTIGAFDVATSSVRECISAFPSKIPVIRLRVLMQYFGTDICRDNLGYNIWVDTTIRKAKDIAENYGYCIIPDVRFANEATGIKNASPSTGEVIKLNRNTGNNDNHSSELVDFHYDFAIDNNESLMQLFYEIHWICRTII